MKGINNSTIVQKTIGSRIRAAREFAPLSRNEFANLLLSNEHYPEVTPRKGCSEITTPTEKLANRIKQWERGENPVGLEYIPAICDVLNCDVGYLFGYYDEHLKSVADICAFTGLSEENVNRLIFWHHECDHRLKNVGNLYIEAASQSLKDILLLAVSSENIQDYPFYDLKEVDSGRYKLLLQDLKTRDDAKDLGYTVLEHKDAAKFYARSIASQLERYLEEVYINGND